MGSGATQHIPVARATSGLDIDGHLNEPAWQAAPVFDSFIQVFPQEAKPPGERTELRVLYDSQSIYFGFRLHDSMPQSISRQMGRRDNPPASDFIQVRIDTMHDHRTAYVFQVTAGGVLLDGLVFQDSNFTKDWDGTWDAAVASTPDGWTAEFIIPLRILRYPDRPEQTWGFVAQRHIARLHEDDLSVFIPNDSPVLISPAGHLSGLSQLRPAMDIEVVSYVGGRAVLRPQFSDPATPQPRLLNPSLDVGLDVKAALSPNLILNTTLNPDFGQVEADKLILNLTTFEAFYPEKRTFFTQEMELFQSVGAGSDGLAPQMLFYSRRIGLTTPIFAAVKLTGSVTDSIDVGLLDAVVAGPADPNPDEADPDRRVQFHLNRPLHLGPNNELPARLPVPENYFVGVIRKKLSGSGTIGARLASAIPLTGTCTEEDAELPSSSRPISCSASGGNAAAVDWDLQTAQGMWGTRGQFTASQQAGGPPWRLLRDGTLLRRGDLGMGAYVEGGKQGGEPFRFKLGYRYASPALDLNAMGYLRSQNDQVASLTLQYVRPSGIGPLHRFVATLAGTTSWTTDGRAINRGNKVNLRLSATVPGFHVLGLNVGASQPAFDVREIAGTGIPFERPNDAFLVFFLTSDPHQVFSIDGYVAFGLLLGPKVKAGPGVDVTMTLRPWHWFETKLALGSAVDPLGPRWLGRSAPGQFLFGELESQFFSLTLSQQFTITPRFTLQAYAQLFTAFGSYGPFYEAAATGKAISLEDLAPATYSGQPSFHQSALNLSLVLRWEYRLGSTLYLVYTHSQTGTPFDAALAAPTTLLPLGLERGPATDGLLIKWSYLWN